MRLTLPHATDLLIGPRLTVVNRWRRGITLALGLVWLLDAALQYQPYMFTKAFPREVITPVGQGSPAWISGPDRWSGHLMADHIVFWNAVFATVQLALALGLFMRRTTRMTLAASFVWAAMVWWLGEGLGGVLAGPVSPLMGLPGAVVIYALIAVLVWPPRTEPEHAGATTSVAEASPIGAVAARTVWAVLWALFAFESLRPADRSPHALTAMVSGMASGEPGWLASLDRWASHALVGDGTQVSVVLAVVFALLAICVVTPVDRRPVLAVGVLISLAIWLIAEDLGEIATGTATDCNSGPLLVLLVACFWPLRDQSDVPAHN